MSPGKIVIAVGEHGTILRSQDDGETFERYDLELGGLWDLLAIRRTAEDRLLIEMRPREPPVADQVGYLSAYFLILR